VDRACPSLAESQVARLFAGREVREMQNKTCNIGMVGLGVMGRNLALNMADHGFSVAGYDLDTKKVEALSREAEGRSVRGFADMGDLMDALGPPRIVMMMVPAGRPVDSVIDSFSPVLAKDDVLIDGGNSYYGDTDGRARKLEAKGVLYMGVGISGGEKGARFGASIMPGGPRRAYDMVRPVLEAIAAKVNGEPCVSYMGPGSAGDYVKMVHNGIEYALMETIAESYDVMKRGLGLSNDKIQAVYAEWSTSILEAYLMEITARIFEKKDDGGRYLLDMILDRAEAKGTGKWTCQDAMDLGVPVPAIDEAVAMRDLSDRGEERFEAARILGPTEPKTAPDAGEAEWVERLGRALQAAWVIVFAQAFVQLGAASRSYGYDLDLSEIARIWRGGCIIRSAFLEPIRQSFLAKPALGSLLLDPVFAEKVKGTQGDLRRLVCFCFEQSLPAPVLSSCLSFLDAFRSPWLPANLLQAQRDFFGSHMYRRIDKEGLFHTEWEG
jgi:6-phosphogluconate dehydrogenase